MTGINGYPQNYMKILISKWNGCFQFVFKGCNCGREIKKGVFNSELIPVYNQPINVIGDETSKALVKCATILGSVMDPGCNVVEYRRRLLYRLRPYWNISDRNVKRTGWIDRCVSGTFWENPNPLYLRTHNMSMNYKMADITGCESRLENESTAGISCEIRVNCGCTIVAPFSLIWEAITAVEGSFLGSTSATIDQDDRIVLKDGLGLVQVEDVGRVFYLMAFGGDADSYKSHSSSCRSTGVGKPVDPKLPWPTGRALVREEFSHAMKDIMRGYGYIETEGSGNLLICRNSPRDLYKIIGVCVDEFIAHKKGRQTVTIR
ncbi:MAG: hypothetical protein M1840_005155 [Geoglossum simile]|nr:MAG: hypothetical protein M1840_005155 [Geoglossum simile]